MRLGNANLVRDTAVGASTWQGTKSGLLVLRMDRHRGIEGESRMCVVTTIVDVMQQRPR